MILRKIIVFCFTSFMIFYSSDLLAPLDFIQYHLKFGNKTYASCDYASSMVAYEKALNYTLELVTQVNAKDSLFLISLKQLITVSGLGDAFEMSEGYFNQFKTKIYKNIRPVPTLHRHWI